MADPDTPVADGGDDAGTGSNSDSNTDSNTDDEPIVVVNYRGVIEEESWEDFKDKVPRSERLEDYINDLIRDVAYDGDDPPHRTANSATPNTITAAERDERQQR